MMDDPQRYKIEQGMKPKEYDVADVYEVILQFIQQDVGTKTDPPDESRMGIRPKRANKAALPGRVAGNPQELCS